MLTAEQREIGAHWLVLHGRALTLREGRERMERAEALADARLAVKDGSGRALPVVGAALVADVEKAIVARGEEITEETFAAELQRQAQPDPEPTGVLYRPSGDALAEAAVVILRQRGREHDADQDAYASALAEADRRLSFTGKGRS